MGTFDRQIKEGWRLSRKKPGCKNAAHNLSTKNWYYQWSLFVVYNISYSVALYVLTSVACSVTLA